MIYLGYRQALWIYRRAIEEFGGTYGVRDEGLLRSALARPQVTFGGNDLYPTLFEKAAALAESMIRNHPFIDGNKRMAWECLDLTLEANGFRLVATTQQGYELMHQIIDRTMTVQDVADWLEARSRRIKS